LNSIAMIDPSYSIPHPAVVLPDDKFELQRDSHPPN
jgi:hypothetical protein